MAIKVIDDTINQLVEERLKVPAFSESAVQFLHILFNASYASKLGVINDLKVAGYSEGYIAGFIGGLQYCSDTLDSAVAKRQSLKDNVQFD
ncbi:hypothetical protein SFP20_040 [Shigella phage SFP20]|uniref:DUF2717 domain-containing protein n=1 Tax=Shigella phage SFP20 TaxID=3017289 RepID=A0AAF0APR8_9CAUD|nr:hypothetical protein SFP20_040 [Shigella phage SFP20]